MATRGRGSAHHGAENDGGEKGQGASGQGLAELLNIATPSRNRARRDAAAAASSGRGGVANVNGASGPRSQGSTQLEEVMRNKGVDEAWTCLEKMQREGILTDKYTVSRMLMKTVGDGRVRSNSTRVYRSIGIVERFIDTQPKDVDEVLFNALLDTCSRLKDLNRFETTVTRMRELKVSPSPVTLGILVKTYGQAGDLEKVLQVWDEMEKQRGQANAVTYGCMIDACVKCNNLPKAVEIFQGMRNEGKHRNTILYTTLIKGYGLDKNLKAALELFYEMPKEGVPYNTITFNSIIDACVKCNDLAQAENLLHGMSAAGVLQQSPLEPDLITFSTLLKGYCYVGELDKALNVAEAIKSRGLRCDELVYNTLLDGCVKADDVAAGLGLFEEMINSGMRPSTITHGILARLYQKAGLEEDAAEAVAELYQHHGLERPVFGGDRGGRRDNRKYQRSPGGRVADFPASTPCSSPLASQSASESCWSAWGEIGGMPYYDGLVQSEPSTPSNSPTAVGGCGPFLPMEALRSPAMGGMVPPLPGTISQDGTPCSQGIASWPVRPGSCVGSPCNPPPQPQPADALAMLVNGPSAGHVQSNGLTSAMAPAQQAATVPPWPIHSSPPPYHAGQIPMQAPPCAMMASSPSCIANQNGQGHQMIPMQPSLPPPATGMPAEFAFYTMPGASSAPCTAAGTVPMLPTGTQMSPGTPVVTAPAAMNIYPEAYFESWAADGNVAQSGGQLGNSNGSQQSVGPFGF